MEKNNSVEKTEVVKLSKVLMAVNQCLAKRGAEKVAYPDILNRIKENYPDFPLEEYEKEEKIWFKTLPKEMADDIRLFYCEGVDFPQDFEEHIYIAISTPRASIFVPLYPREFVKAQYMTPQHPEYADYVDKKKRITMRSNTYGVIDLAHYKKEFPQGEKEKKIYNMRFYANWILNAFPGTKEIPFEDFAKGKVLLSPKEETSGGVISKIRKVTREIKMLPGTELGEQARGLLKEIDEITADKE